MTTLTSISSSFDSLVQLIPPKFYFQIEHPTEDKFTKNKAQKAPKQNTKETSKRGMKASRLDPSNTVLGIQSEKVLRNPVHERVESVVKDPLDLKVRLARRIQELKDARGAPKSKQELLQKRATKREKKVKKKDSRKMILDTKGMAVMKEAKVEDKSVPEGLMFGKIDFGEKVERKSIDAAAMLKKAEQKQVKLSLLDKEKQDTYAQKDTWSKLNSQAAGKPVRDDIKLLKKTVKRQQTEKKKSSSEWTERKELKDKDQDIKAKKRKDNIQSRIDLKKKKKFGGVTKKAKPGFK